MSGPRTLDVIDREMAELEKSRDELKKRLRALAAERDDAVVAADVDKMTPARRRALRSILGVAAIAPTSEVGTPGAAPAKPLPPAPTAPTAKPQPIKR